MLTRRSFLATALASGLLIRPAQAKPPARELLGIERPELFGDGFNLRKEAAQAFEAMQKEARQAGIEIYSQSSYRSFDHQKRIWNRKYRWFRDRQMSSEQAVAAILRYSSLPGGSRHHWGTDADLVDHAVEQPASLLTAKNYHAGGAFEKLYDWLNEHAHRFDFHLVYTQRESRPGFSYEPWHWSYAPLGVPYLKAYQELDLYKAIPVEELGGHEQLDADFFQRYMKEWALGINPRLLPDSMKPEEQS